MPKKQINQTYNITEESIDNIHGLSKAAKVRAKQSLRSWQKAIAAVESKMIGHNSGAVREEPEDGQPKDVGGIAGARLNAFVERVERLEEEKRALQEDIKEVYAEAKGVGFDVKTMRKIVTLRKLEPEKRRENKELLDLYAAAVGLQYPLEV